MPNEKEMVSLNALNAAVKEAAPRFEAKFAAKSGVAADPGAVANVEGFCALCAKVRPFLNMAIKAAAMFAPKPIPALAKTFMSVFYGQIVPTFCGPQE